MLLMPFLLPFGYAHDKWNKTDRQFVYSLSCGNTSTVMHYNANQQNWVKILRSSNLLLNFMKSIASILQCQIKRQYPSSKFGWIFNNNWMRLNINLRIMDIAEDIIRRGQLDPTEADNTLRDENSIILQMIQKPNSIIVLLFIQNNS